MLVAVLGGVAGAADAVPPDRLFDGESGVSCTHLLANVVPWQRRGGDWRDADARMHGDKPHASARVVTPSTVIDVSRLVRAALKGNASVVEWFLKPVGGGGYLRFHSRESNSPADRPILIVDRARGGRELLSPFADSVIDCSTYRGRGQAAELMVSGSHGSVMAFSVPQGLTENDFKRARLVLSSLNAGGNLDIGVFEIARPASGGRDSSGPGAAKSGDVVFQEDFEQGEFRGFRGKFMGDGSEAKTVSEPDVHGFLTRSGKALRVKLAKGSNLGLDYRVYLRDHGGEPEEIFFRYYLRLGNSWNPVTADGKLPGLAGTYNRAGWGGRKVSGSDGWSARGAFLRSFEAGHPYHGLTQIGSYVYHADMAGQYGDVWVWPGALLKREQWYSIEQYLRLNRPGQSDGIMRAWVDGKQVFERVGIRFRATDRLRIETAWLNVYYGGKPSSPTDQHLYIDDIVIARRYIGPATP